jgi:conjugative transfer signal peptidase TraF
MTVRRLLLTSLASAAVLAVTAPAPRAPRLVWNTTASAPMGLYRLAPDAPLSRGVLVAAQPPPWLARDLAARGVVPRGVPLIKPVAALAGQTVCRDGARLLLDGVLVARARRQDRRGAALPTWRGCRRLGAGDVLLLNPTVPDSFDGRYFGVLPRACVLGRVHPVWIAHSSRDAPSPADRERW